jgi:hypothetical protein
LNGWILTSGLAGALALPLLLAPATASASCNDRKVVGTVAGGVGGALIGNSIAHGGAGAVLGGLGGAVIGHEVARSSCHHESHYGHAEYDRGHYRSYQGAAPANAGAYAPSAPAQQTVYYDNRGNVVYPAAPPAAAPTTYAASYPSSAPACSVETRSYYNDRGELVQHQVQTCAP